MAEELQKPEWMADNVWNMLTDETKKSMARRNPTFETNTLEQQPKAIDVQDNETDLTTAQTSMPVVEKPVVEEPVVNETILSERERLDAEAEKTKLNALANENQTFVSEGELYLSTDMYDQMTFREAVDWYNSILDRDDVTSYNRGDTNNPLAQAVHTDEKRNTRRYVPYPEKKFGSSMATVSYSQMATTGFKEAVGDAAVLLGALWDTLSDSSEMAVESSPGVKEEVANQDFDKLLRGDNDQTSSATKSDFSLAEYIESKTASAETAGILDALIVDGLPMALSGGGTALAIFKKFPKASEKLGKWGKRGYGMLRGLASAVGGELVASAQVGTEEGTIALGENSVILKNWAGLDLQDESLAARTLEHRVNTFVESMALVGGLAPVAAAALPLTNIAYKTFLSGLVSLASTDNSLEKQVFLKLMDQMTIDVNASPELQQQAIKNIAEIIEENKSVIVKMIDGTDGNQEVFVDTLTALIRGTDDPQLSSTASSIQRGNINNAGELKEATSSPSRVLDEQLDAQRQLLGGDAANQNQLIENTAEVIVDPARKTIDDVQTNLGASKAQFDADSQAILDGFETDLEFIGLVKELEDVSGTKINVRQDATFDSITEGIRNSHAILKNEKDAAFNAISGGSVDADGIINKILALEPEQLDTAFTALGTDKSQFGTILKQRNVFKREIDAEIRAAAKEGEEIFIDVDAEVADRLTDWFRTQDVDFGVLYTEIRPAVSKMASMMFDSRNVGDAAVGALLRDFVRYIDTDALKFASDADPDLKPLTEAAMEAYKKYAKIFNSGGRMSSWRELYDRTIARTATGEASAARLTGEEFSSAGFREDQETIVKGVLQGGNTNQIVNLADAIETAGNPNDVADYLIMDLINNFAVDVRTSTMAGADFSSFANQLRQFATVLNKRFPDKAEKVNQFVLQVEKAGNSREAIEPLLQQAKEAADIEMQALSENIVYQMLTSNPKLAKVTKSVGLEVTSNPSKGFEQIFNHKEAVNHTKQMINTINELPVGEQKLARDGLRLMYNRWITNRIFNQGVESGGGRAVSSAKIDAGMQGSSVDFEIGKLLWEDTPVVMKTITELVDFANQASKAKRTVPIAGQSPTDYSAAARTATNRLIYTLIGPLSRTGTRVRTGVNAVLDRLTINERANLVMQKILANPNEFIRLEQKYNKTPNDPLLAETFQRFFLSGAIKSDMNSAEGEPLELGGLIGVPRRNLENIGNAATGLMGIQ